MSAMPQVSLIVVAYNAATDLRALLADVRAQTFPMDALEVVLVDSASQDDTLAVMRGFAADAPMAVQVLENPGRVLPCGCNIALRACRGAFVVRLDAHARIAPDFLQRGQDALAQGHDIVGGQVETLPQDTPWRAAIAQADASRFGGGAAAFRNPGTAREVDTLAYPMLRRSAYDAVGLYDERLVRTEDNDMAYRLRKAGYRFYYTPSIRVARRARPTLRGLLQQKHQTGRWVGLTMAVQPCAFAPRHFVPALFVLALVGGTALALCGLWQPLAALVAVYAACDLGFSAQGACVAPLGRLRCALCLPWIFPLLHVSYGLGTWRGLMGARRLARTPKTKGGERP